MDGFDIKPGDIIQIAAKYRGKVIAWMYGRFAFDP